MGEFFTRKETESRTRPDGKTYSCISCGLYQFCKTPKMAPYGNFKKKILNIGEAPGEVEDSTGRPFQGPTGKALARMYKSLGIDLFEDCLNINAINCHPEGNSTPDNYEIECCRQIVFDVIDKYKPKVIILLGNSAIYSVIGHRWKKDLGGVSKWRGWQIPDQDFETWICPTFHPSFIERSDSEDISIIWKSDLKKALEKLNDPFPKYKEPTIEYIEDLSPLRSIKGPIAFDYETTGLKPHAEGHRIICAAVANTPNHVFSFMMPSTREGRKPFLELLANPKVGKMAQNIKYEDTWSEVRLRQSVESWEWDTMQASHILDNRPGVTGLKFQTYVQFGIIDYASEISPFLQATDNSNGNALNKIGELLKLPGGQEKLLHYCALDAVFEYRLAILQQSQILLPF